MVDLETSRVQFPASDSNGLAHRHNGVRMFFPHSIPRWRKLLCARAQFLPNTAPRSRAALTTSFEKFPLADYLTATSLKRASLCRAAIYRSILAQGARFRDNSTRRQASFQPDKTQSSRCSAAKRSLRDRNVLIEADDRPRLLTRNLPSKQCVAKLNGALSDFDGKIWERRRQPALFRQPAERAGMLRLGRWKVAVSRQGDGYAGGQPSLPRNHIRAA